MDAGLYLYIYFGAVGVASVGLYLALYRKLSGVSVERQRRVLRRRRFEAVPGDSFPVDDPNKVAKARAVKNIERSFSITRRWLLPFVLFFTILLVSLPFADQVPGVLVSLVATAVTLLVGVAARPVIENVIAGLLVSFSKTLNIGDTVKVENEYGTIEDIRTVHTIIKLWDWRRLMIPNSRLLQSCLVNYSLMDTNLWSRVEFWVAHGTDIREVEAIALSIPARSRFFTSSDAPEFWVMELEKEGIRCWLVAWAKSPSEAWMLNHQIRTELIKEFQSRGIETHAHRWSRGDDPSGGSLNPNLTLVEGGPATLSEISH